MRRWSFLLMVIGLCLLIVLPVSAQDTAPETWYFADSRDGQLLSYNPSGDVHTLIESGFGGLKSFDGWRLTSDLALAVMEVNKVWGLYYLTSEEAHSIELTRGATLMRDDVRWWLATYRSPYAVLVPIALDGTSAILVNLETRSAEPLTGIFPNLGLSLVRFNEDGRYLRYLSRHSEDEKTWSIYERKLSTGDEREFYTFSSEFPPISTNHYGEYWLYSSAEAPVVLISANGETETLAPNSKASENWYHVYDNHLMVVPKDCVRDCQLLWQPLDGEETTTFMLPEMVDSAYVIREVDDSQVVLLSGNTVWQVGGDGTAIDVGRSVVGEVVASPYKVGSLSDRYVLVLSGQQSASGVQYQVWDTVKRENIIGSGRRVLDEVHITYGQGGFIVDEDSARQALYRYTDETLIELPKGADGIYLDVLPGGTALYAQITGRYAGIYTYNPLTDSYPPVVRSVWPLILGEPLLSYEFSPPR